jgi:hypothetical protein
MDVAAVFVELFDRVPPLAREATEGVDADGLVFRPGPKANTIAWLIWHSARIQDAQIAELVDADQLWVTGEWAERLGLPPDPRNHGYGHSPTDVMSVRPKAAGDVVDYLEAVSDRTRTMLQALSTADLDRVVDRNYDPPVTLGVRLVSVADDCLQHLGQAAYIRGLLP